MLFLKEPSSRFIGDIIGAGDEGELKRGIGDVDVGVVQELSFSNFLLTKAVFIP